MYSLDPEMRFWLHKKPEAYLNIYRQSMERRLRQIESSGYPFILYYEPTTFCNLKCPACPTGIGTLERESKKANVEEFKRTIDALGDWVFMLFMYNWGEPLLHKNFSEMVQYASRKGISVYTSTNLSRQLTEEQCAAIVQSGLYSLKVGIDGATQESHSRYRVGSDLSLVHYNLRQIVEQKRRLNSQTPKIGVAYHVFEHNEHEIADFATQMKEIGVDSYSANPSWTPAEDGSVKKAKNPQYDMYAKVNQKNKQLQAQGANLKPCTWLYYSSIINPNGAVSSCCGVLSEKLDFGRLPASETRDERSAQFREIWNGTHYQSARRMFDSSIHTQKWIEQNLQADIEPNGMALSQTTQDIRHVCASCPIPFDIDRWSNQVKSIHKKHYEYAMAIKNNMSLPEFEKMAIVLQLLDAAVKLQ